MKKSTLYLGILYTIIGVTFFLVAFLYEFSFEGIMWDFSGAGIGSGLTTIYKYLYWSRPSKSEQYKQKLYDEHIEMNDERKIMLRDKSGRISYVILLAMYIVLIFIFSMLGAFSIMPIADELVIGLSLLMMFQFICGIIVFQYLNKKL